jgi:hypothetical protein
MIRHRSLKLVTLLSLTALPLGTIGCSNGSSPTEPAFSDDQPTLAASTSGLSSVTDESKGRGGDDNSSKSKKGRKGRRGRGGDDKAGDDNGGRRGGRNGGQDDDNNNQRTGQEFEGAVASVNGAVITLTDGTRVIVNGQTQWIARGDLQTLDQVAGSVAADRPTRVEGRGTRQGNGNILALTLKAEVDD